MALDNAKNFAKVEVSTGYDASATSIILVASEGAKLPTASFNAVWYNSTDYTDPTDDPNREIVRVTNISTDTLTVTRAQEGTSAATHNTGGKTYKMIAGLTAKTINTDIPALIPTVPTIVSNEVPTGSINSSNQSFVLANTPNPASSLAVYLNGQRLTVTGDYTLSTDTISMVIAPVTGDILFCDYRY